MTSGQEKIRLDMAIRIFCHGTDEDPGHRQRCGEYLRLRHRALAQRLLEDGDLSGIRVCMAAEMFPAEETEKMLCMAVQKGRTDCLGALLSQEKETLPRMAVQKDRTDCRSVFVSPEKPADEPAADKSVRPLYTRILDLLGRRFDRFRPYLGQMFHMLPVCLKEDMGWLGTDGFSLFVREKDLLDAFSADTEICQRDVAHVLIHSLLFHPLHAKQAQEQSLWDVCCDCMAEWTLDERMGYVRLLSGQEKKQRKEVYIWLEKENIVTAAMLYRRMKDRSPKEREGFGRLFGCDDHHLWYTVMHSPEEWRRQIRRQKRAAASGAEDGTLGGILGSGGHTVKKYREPLASEYDYQAFLERFMVEGEERILNPDSFDPIFYDYSRRHYDGPVLLEPLETSEVRRLSELVIAIDTSGSCSGEIVRQFLRETFTILEKKERFFRRMRVHILQCDSMIQDYQLIESEQDWQAYRKKVKITGFGNTDFRPVFAWIEKNRQTGVIRDIKGLIYFTDGDGIYPRSAPDYETVFVYLNERLMKGKMPEYIRPLNLHIDREFANLFDEESSYGYCGGKQEK